MVAAFLTISIIPVKDDTFFLLLLYNGHPFSVLHVRNGPCQEDIISLLDYSQCIFTLRTIYLAQFAPNVSSNYVPLSLAILY